MIKLKKRKNLYLVGFMGAGKTTIGVALAKKLEREFIDTDQAITKIFGKPIPEIFSEKGEAFFREYEAEILQDIAREFGRLIALGGGTLESANNRHLVQSTGQSVYLRWKFENLLHRLEKNTDRPLVLNKSRGQLRELFDNRAPFFEAADLIVDCDRCKTPRDIVTEIMSQIEKG